MLSLVNPLHASARHWSVAVSEPNQDVDSPANCSVADFVGNSDSSTQDAVVDELVGEKADFRE